MDDSPDARGTLFGVLAPTARSQQLAHNSLHRRERVRWSPQCLLAACISSCCNDRQDSERAQPRKSRVHFRSTLGNTPAHSPLPPPHIDSASDPLLKLRGYPARPMTTRGAVARMRCGFRMARYARPGNSTCSTKGCLPLARHQIIRQRHLNADSLRLFRIEYSGSI